MERKTIFLALFSAFVACFFVACSNDSDALDINAIDIKAGTRSVGLSSYMTREEIQTRLNEIGNKYGVRVIIDEGIDTDLITDDIFTKLEEHLSSNKLECINDETSLFLDDSSVDEIMPVSERSSNEAYSGSFDVTVRYNCVNQQNQSEEVVSNITISWITRDPSVSSSLGLSARIDTGHGNNVQISYSKPGGTPELPSFDYSGTITCNNTVLKCDTIFMKDEYGNNDGQNHIYDIFINGYPARLEYHYDNVSKIHTFRGSYPKLK